MLTAQRIDAAGRRIAYTASPGTGRPLVFLHGNSSSSRVWQHLLEGDLGRRHRCLAPDLPDHGGSARAPELEDYSLPGYAAVLTAFLEAADVSEAVIVGWSLGGHIALESAPHLDRAAAFVIFGTPPIGSLADFGEAFLPNPAVNLGFTADLDKESALAYAVASLAPGTLTSDSATSPDRLADDILATDGRARLGLGASVQAGRFADERDIVGQLTRPLAVLHGEHDQLINPDYIRTIAMPSLWRGDIQVVPDAGHALMTEAPGEFSRLLKEFLADLG